MLAHNLQAKTVQGPDVRRRQQRQLLLDPRSERRVTRVRRGRRKCLTNPCLHFRRGRLGERHDQELVDIRRIFRIQHARQTALDQRFGFSCACAREHQQVSFESNRACLRNRELAHASVSFKARYDCSHGSKRQIGR